MAKLIQLQEPKPIITRRALLGGIATVLCAPALVRASSLEYIPRAEPAWVVVWDSMHAFTDVEYKYATLYSDEYPCGEIIAMYNMSKDRPEPLGVEMLSWLTN